MKHRVWKALAVALLALAPLTYLVVGAVQSLAGSEGKERIASATEPLVGRPPHVMRNIYGVQMPWYTTYNRYFETNSWKTSSLYLRFDTGNVGIETFFREVGIKRTDLRPGYIPITRAQQKTFGWDFHGDWAKQQGLAGVIVPAEGKGKPERRVLVNFNKDAKPWEHVEKEYSIYVVSTITY